MHQAMLTTVDNPYDPFDEFDSWLNCDYRLGYDSTGLLARVMIMSDELSVPDTLLAIEAAIDEIVALNVSGVHRKVTRPIPDDQLLS